MGLLLPGINLVGFLERVCFEFQLKKQFQRWYVRQPRCFEISFLFLCSVNTTQRKSSGVTEEGIDQGVHKGTFHSNGEEMKKFSDSEIFQIF